MIVDPKYYLTIVYNISNFFTKIKYILKDFFLILNKKCIYSFNSFFFFYLETYYYYNIDKIYELFISILKIIDI